MEGVTAFGAAFALVALLELGDKTQLLVISLATRHAPLPIAAGAFLGETAVTAIAVSAGVVIASFVDVRYVQVASGAIFVAIGVWRLWEKETGASEPNVGKPFTSAMGLSFLAELGDKSMFAVIALVATLQAPISVYLGASAALLAMVVFAVVVGKVLRRYLSTRWLRYVGAGLFLLAGALIIVDALLRG